MYTCSFRRHFLLQVESKYLATCGFHSWSQSQTVFDNWQRRLDELTKDALGILNIQLNIRKLRECDFNSHGEWIYRVPEKTSKNFYITGEREYQEMLKKAKEGNLPNGYLIRVSINSLCPPGLSPPPPPWSKRHTLTQSASFRSRS